MDKFFQYCRMSIIWGEREHTSVDNAILQYQESSDAIKFIGLLRFFMMPNMKTQT